MAGEKIDCLLDPLVLAEEVRGEVGAGCAPGTTCSARLVETSSAFPEPYRAFDRARVEEREGDTLMAVGDAEWYSTAGDAEEAGTGIGAEVTDADETGADDEVEGKEGNGVSEASSAAFAACKEDDAARSRALSLAAAAVNGMDVVVVVGVGIGVGTVVEIGAVVGATTSLGVSDFCGVAWRAGNSSEAGCFAGAGVSSELCAWASPLPLPPPCSDAFFEADLIRAPRCMDLDLFMG